MSKRDDHYGLQSPEANLHKQARIDGDDERAFSQITDKPEPEPDEVADDQPPAPPRRPKIDKHGDTILYQAGDALADPASWPCVVEPAAAENGHYLMHTLDGDSAVALVEVINALQVALDTRHDFAISTANGARLNEKSLPHLLRFIVRAAGPLLSKHLDEIEGDAAAEAELRTLLDKTLRGTSVVKERDEAERERQKVARTKAEAEAARKEHLRKQAEAAVAAEEVEERRVKVETKLAALSAK